MTIIGGSHLAKTSPPTQVYKTEERHAKHARRELEDIIFTKVDARWVHHPHANALVITAQIANSDIHRLMVDDGNVVDILYLDAYKRIGLDDNALSPATSPLYGFTRDHVMPKGTTKLAVTMGEHPRT